MVVGLGERKHSSKYDESSNESSSVRDDREHSRLKDEELPNDECLGWGLTAVAAKVLGARERTGARARMVSFTSFIYPLHSLSVMRMEDGLEPSGVG
jgi:hypothetical protein